MGCWHHLRVDLRSGVWVRYAYRLALPRVSLNGSSLHARPQARRRARPQARHHRGGACPGRRASQRGGDADRRPASWAAQSADRDGCGPPAPGGGGGNARAPGERTGRSRHARAAAGQADGEVVDGAGAVGVTAPPRPLHFPIRGKGTETVHAVAAAAPAKITGYDSRTSRMLALSSATQVTYANADGTHTAVELSLIHI